MSLLLVEKTTTQYSFLFVCFCFEFDPAVKFWICLMNMYRLTRSKGVVAKCWPGWADAAGLPLCLQTKTKPASFGMLLW